MVNRFKFRVWDNKNNYMFTHSYNDWNNTEIKDFDFMFLMGGKLRLADDGCSENNCYEFLDHCKEYDEQQYILMQSTGLKDKNGKEIFENDIVSICGEQNQIVWDEEYAGFSIKDMKEEFYMTLRKGDLLEVIGNIYEGVNK